MGTCGFTRSAEGAGGAAHGASIALVFDEVLAYPVWRQYSEFEPTTFTANLNINYRRMVPLLATLCFESRVVKVEKGRKFFVEATIFAPVLDEDGNEVGRTVYTDATGLWLAAKKKPMAKL